MNISDIITKCYILALIIRDDGERLLLGDGFYEFTEQLQHFQPNTFQNDVIELQGTDGQLLAGQVRRGATQSFDGYIADSTISREATEEHRQRFLAFFRKKHHYKVVYVFPDGSAIKRERGYIVDAPSVPEMFQRFPEFHVGLNFEDVNYYEYEEGEDGEEIFAHVQNIAIAGYVEGGLIWDNYGAVSNEITWVDYALKTTTDGYAQITDGVLGAPLNLTQLFGNTTQTTLSGKNKFSFNIGANPQYPASGIAITKDDNNITILAETTSGAQYYGVELGNDFDAAKQYVFSCKGVKLVKGTDGSPYLTVRWRGSNDNGATWTNYNDGYKNNPTQGTTYDIEFTVTGYKKYAFYFYGNAGMPVSMGEKTQYTNIQFEEGTASTAFEQYCGGIPSPNPDFPQTVNTVTGLQTVKITGKNLFDKNTITSGYLVSRGIGTLSQNISYGATDFIPVRAGQQLHFGADFNRWYSAYYDANKVAVGEPTNTANITIPDGVAYLRTSLLLTNLDTAQLELGSTATDYEPYQAKTYEINLGGTNILPSTGTTPVGGTGVSITRNNDGTYTVNGTASSGGYIDIGTIDFKQGQTYTISGLTGWTATTLQLFTISDTAFSLGHRLASYNGPTTQTALGDETCNVRLYVYQGTTYNNVVVKPMVQLGSQATSYAQHTDYAYELCKIDTYRDRIYENDGEWYKHAEIGKVVFDGSQALTLRNTSANGTYTYSMNTPFDYKLEAGTSALSDHFKYLGIVGGVADMYNANKLLDKLGIALYYNSSFPTSSSVYFNSNVQLPTWLSTHNTTVYYALNTPTDTKITDQELIQQLSTIKALVGETDNIWLIPSSGAQGEMEVRYSRGFINQGAGYEWDAAQGGGPNIVSVDGIDRTGFVWEVVGPATNPTLTNITTNQTMTFEGDVATGQTLTVNTSDQTAEIAGTNVFAQMEGDWMQLAPGNNVITYTATGATEPSKIKWNGVVG